MFYEKFKNYDVIVVCPRPILSPFKSIYGFDGINLTLQIFKSFTDHGITKNLIKKKQAN